MSKNNQYLSDINLKCYILFWSIIPPLHLIIIISHILIWYLYLIYYGKNSSLNYLYIISSKISSKYPRFIYFIPMIILLILFFIFMIITYSINVSSNKSAKLFVCFIVIFECVFGILISLKLISISLTMVQNEFLLTKHEEITMKILFFCSISCLIVFTTIFILGIAIYDQGNYFQYQSYLPDIMRIFQLLFELIFIILCTIIFIYIPPSPELHKMHRSSFHLSSFHLSSSNNNYNNQDDNYGIDNAQNILKKNTKVYIYNELHDIWSLGTVNKMVINNNNNNNNNNRYCFVTMDDDEKDNVVIDLNTKEAKDIKLAIFGINPKFLNNDRDEKYNLNSIPLILINLRDLLFKFNGHYKEGIFRKEAMKLKYNIFKFAVEQNRINSFNYDEFDVNNISNLIKEFYRSMPNNLKCLQNLSFSGNKNINNDILTIDDMKLFLNNKNKKYKINNKNSKILLIWIWSLMADLSQYSKENKMTINALAVIISPNLYFTNDPIQMINLQTNIIKFCQLGINYCLQKRILQQ